MFLTKNPPRTSTTSGMGFMLELFNTPGECYRQLCMSIKKIFDLHRLLVEKYVLSSSLHMSTTESLGILLFICSENESNNRSKNRLKHSGEIISRKFEEVLFSLMSMSKDFIRPKDPNFHTIHRRIRDDKRAYPYFKDCIGALDGTHIPVTLPPDEQVRYIGKIGIPTLY
jgi:hypothetical protein